jgi:5-methylcytosine-specific restriction protein B
VPEATLATWIEAIERKGQAILYGPPGTGKTWTAKHFARHLVQETDGFHDLVQFHPSYAYEDFIQGIRPESASDGTLRYPLRAGRFLDFCERASARTGRCVLIVDEINRGNLSRIFGELMFLLEYRNEGIPLAGGNRFRIPSNVRLLGTMNTADRSIALVDHALRRRFAFFQLSPDFALLARYHEEGDPLVPRLIRVLEEVNALIGDPHYAIGTSYFLTPDLAGSIESIWRMEIEPYLEEQFFDRRERVAQFRWDRVRERLEP